MSGRVGLTIGLAGESLRDLPAVLAAAEAGGYTDLWSSEGAGADAFSPLVAAAAQRPGLRYGTAIASVFARTPTLLAMNAAALCDLVSADPRGEVALGIGSSSEVMVSQWHGVPFVDPVGRVRDVLAFLRRAFAGEKVSLDTPSFQIDGFRLATPPDRPPTLLVAALRPRMLALAGRDADGTILNWLAPADVEKVAEVVRRHRSDAEIVARVFAVVGEDEAAARATARRMVAAYLTVPVYAEFQRWLGRGDDLTDLWQAWAAGDRRGALDAVPDRVLDELFLFGDAASVQAGLDRYRDAGVDTTVLALTCPPESREKWITALGPGTRN